MVAIDSDTLGKVKDTPIALPRGETYNLIQLPRFLPEECLLWPQLRGALELVHKIANPSDVSIES